MAGYALQRSAFMEDNIFHICVCRLKELNQCTSLSRCCQHCGATTCLHFSNMKPVEFLPSSFRDPVLQHGELNDALQFPFRITNNQIICYSWYILSRALGAFSAHLPVVNKTLGVTASLSFHFMNSLSQRYLDRWGWEMDSAFFSSSAIILRHSPPSPQNPFD